MVSVYKITDCNDLNYIGTTKQTLSHRMSQHRYAKRNPNRHKCSSSKLDLDNCHITLLEICNDENRNDKEQYWINKFECVNLYPTIPYCKTHPKEFRKNVTSYRTKLRRYQRTWGGDPLYNNNLLKIDVNVFT